MHSHALARAHTHTRARTHTQTNRMHTQTNTCTHTHAYTQIHTQHIHTRACTTRTGASSGTTAWPPTSCCVASPCSCARATSRSGASVTLWLIPCWPPPAWHMGTQLSCVWRLRKSSTRSLSCPPRCRRCVGVGVGLRVYLYISISLEGEGRGL
jgi:hypothetical protein